MPDLLLVEALNLSDQTTADNVEKNPVQFKKVCLFEFKDWIVRVTKLCEQADFVLFHLDDASDGLQEELRIISEFAPKTIIFAPRSFEHGERVLPYGFPWLALIKYQIDFDEIWQEFPEEIHFLNATVTTNVGVRNVEYTGQWLREFLQLTSAAGPQKAPQPGEVH